MIVKNIDRDDFKFLIEEQSYNNKLYRISKSYAPNIGIDEESIRISISYLKDNSIEEHGVEIIGETIKSYYLRHKENKSTYDGDFTDDNYEYVDEIKNGINDLINSGSCDFSDESLLLLEKINLRVK